MKTYLTMAAIVTSLFTSMIVVQDATDPANSQTAAQLAQERTWDATAAVAASLAGDDYGIRFPQMSKSQMKAEIMLKKTVSQLQAAQSDEEQADAERQLRESLGQVYDERLNVYDEQLTRLQKKISELKDQVKRRRAARDEMVELRFKVIVNDARGFGWPKQSMGGGTYFGIDSVKNLDKKPSLNSISPEQGSSR